MTNLKLKHQIKQARAEFGRLKRRYKAGQLDLVGVSRASAINRFLNQHDPKWREAAAPWAK